MRSNTHTDNYSEFSPGNSGQYKYAEEWEQRREAIEEFLDSVLQYDDVRVVPFKDVIAWIKNPVKSSEYVAPTKKTGGVAITDKKQGVWNRGLTMSTDKRNLSITVPSSGNYLIQVASLSGQIISEVHSGNLNAGEHSISLSGISAATGVYIVQVTGTINGVARVLLK